MLDLIFTGLSWILIAAGSFFYVVGAIGVVRMPDVFARMHAAGISDTVGAGLLIGGMMIEAGLTLVAVKLLIILLVILFTSPVATHALAQAALQSGCIPVLANKKALGIPVEEAATRQAFESLPKRKPKRKSGDETKGGTPSKPS